MFHKKVQIKPKQISYLQ